MKDIKHPDALFDAAQDMLFALYDIDLTKVGGGITYFSPHFNEKGEPVTWRGQRYTPYPITAEGFRVSGDGPTSRPTLTVSNILGWVTGAVAEYDGVIGCKVTRRRVLARHLDAVNFTSGQNPNHDPLAEIIDRWTINRLVSLNSRAATFELASPAETDNAVIPARPVLAVVSPTLQELRQRYGKTAVLPYRGFPSINRRGA